MPGAAPPAEVAVQTVDRAVRTGLAAVRAELQVPDTFPPQVVAAARSAAPQVPSRTADATHVPFVTIDPAGSMDLDQALHVERRGGPGGGFRVHYAIADVAAWVPAGGPVDTEARAGS